MVLLQKTSAVEAVVKLLIDRIHRGDYLAGQKLPSERLLQEELGVGRLTLREALSRLNAMGIISTAHGKGTYVEDDIKSQTFRDILVPYFALNDPKRLNDLVVARSMLESEIAGLAAEQRTEADLVSLTEIVERTFPQDINLEEVARQDLLFHRTLAEIIDNGFLAKMHEALVDNIRLFLNEYVKSKTCPEEVMRPHVPILEAIKLGDAEAARHHARMHVSYSVQDYEKYIHRTFTGRQQ
jgi:GntR family transcriptional regulator, transcriptional repressor for pyruvate dehydrogenase complex